MLKLDLTLFPNNFKLFANDLNPPEIEVYSDENPLETESQIDLNVFEIEFPIFVNTDFKSTFLIKWSYFL